MLDSILVGKKVNFAGRVFPLSSEYISILHHWHFGLTKDYYRSKDKFVLLPDCNGEIVKVTDISGLLDEMMKKYDLVLSEQYKE